MTASDDMTDSTECNETNKRVTYHRMGGWLEGYVGISIDGEPWKIIQ